MADSKRYPPQYEQQFLAPRVTDQFRDLMTDPYTGQLRERATGPYAGPTVGPQQWMNQHPLMQLGNLFTWLSAQFAPPNIQREYEDPWQAPASASDPSRSGW